MRSAFTLIELVFVIVILGVLVAIAVPRFANVGEEAQITKGRSDIATIRSSVMTEHQKLILGGSNAYPALDNNATDNQLFDNILDYPIFENNSSGNWRKNNFTGTSYVFRIGDVNVTFSYNNTTGIFDCDHSIARCQDLTE